jgi:hypothetical protein
VSEGVDGGDAPGSPADPGALTGYDLWDRTEHARQLVAAAYQRVLAAGAEPARVAEAAVFLRRVRQLLALRLAAVAGDRRRAFRSSVPPAGSSGVAALWAEVFWAARAAAPDDDSGVLEATDASIRGLLALAPSALAAPDAAQAWWRRLELVEETFGGLEVQAQAAVEGRRH